MVCCVTGHRPNGFPFPRVDNDYTYFEYVDTLYLEIEDLIRKGYRHFITGMAEGADIDFAEAVLYYRDNEEEDVALEAALPCPLSYPKEITEYIEKRYFILESCDSKNIISPHYYRGCMQKRNGYMVDKSDLVLAIWNGQRKGGTWNTIKYAISVGKPIRYIMLNKISTIFD